MPTQALMDRAWGPSPTSSWSSCYTTTSDGQVITVIVTKTQVVDVTATSTTTPNVVSPSPVSNTASYSSTTTQTPALVPVTGGSVPASSPPVGTTSSPFLAQVPSGSLVTAPSSMATMSFTRSNSSAQGENMIPSVPPRSSASIAIAIVVAIVALVLAAALVWALIRLKKIRKDKERTEASRNVGFGWSAPSAGGQRKEGLGIVDTLKEKLGRNVSISRRRSFLNYVPPISSMPTHQTSSSSARHLENIAPTQSSANWQSQSRKPNDRSLRSEKHVYPEDGRLPFWKAHIRGICKDGSGSSSGSGSGGTPWSSSNNLLGSKSKRSHEEESYDLDDHPLPVRQPKPKAAGIIVSQPRPLTSGTTARFGGVDSMPPLPRTAPLPPPSGPLPPLPQTLSSNATYFPPLEPAAGSFEMVQTHNSPTPGGPRLHSSFSSSTNAGSPSAEQLPPGQRFAGWVRRQMELHRKQEEGSSLPPPHRPARDEEMVDIRPGQSFMNV